MKNLIFITMLVLIAGCSKMDKQQALADCKFDAVKKMRNETGETDDYTYSCMKANGYSPIANNVCYAVYPLSPDCWDYSWRVFLH